MPDTLTRPPGNQRPEDDRLKLNPSQEEFNELVRREYAPGEGERIAREQAEALREEEASAAAEAEQIAREASNEPVKDLEESPSGQGGLYTGSGKQKKPSSLQKRRRQAMLIGGIIMTIVGGITSIILTLGSLLHAPHLSMNNLAARISRAIVSRRDEQLKKRYFEVKDCSGKGVVCRMTRGISEKEIKVFKDAGILTDEGIGTDQKGRKFVKFFEAIDETGNKVRVTSGNFSEFFKNNIAFKAAVTSFSSTRALLARSAQSVKFMTEKLHANLRAPFGEKDTTEDAKKGFRRYMYGEGDSRFKTGNSDIDNAADEEAKKAATDGPSVIDNTAALEGTPTQAVEAAKAGIKGIIKRPQDALNFLGNGCQLYSTIRKATFGAKIIKGFLLMKYAVSFFTEIEAAKAGHAHILILAFLISVLMRPSKEKGHENETFFNSNGKSWILEGKIAKPDDLARFAIASPRLNSFNEVKRTFEDFGLNRTTCGAVDSPIGQILLIGGTLLLDLSTGGSTAVARLAAQAGISFVIGFALAYATPWLMSFIAGTVAPDFDHPGGGQAAGEALFAGISAATMFTGRASGMRAMRTPQLAATVLDLQPEIASLDKLDHWHKSPFSLDEPDSIPNKLAYAIAPFAAAPLANSTFQNLAQIITSPFGLVASSFNSMLTHSAHAEEIADLKGQYCGDDDYAALGLAVDAGCGVVHALTTDELNISDEEATKYLHDTGQFDESANTSTSDTPASPQPVAATPQQGNVAQAFTNLLAPQKASAQTDDSNLQGPIKDTSKPKEGSDLKEFIDTCVNGTIPYSPDGGGIEVTDNVDTRQCLSDEKKYQMFHVYALDTGLFQSGRDDLNGKLGINADSDLTP